MLQKIYIKLFPYWCSYCPRRFRTEEKFADHYFSCDYRELARIKKDAEMNRAIEYVAPINRQQRRAMAKKAGRIKEWDFLNGE